jgi:hypothetical protein
LPTPDPIMPCATTAMVMLITYLFEPVSYPQDSKTGVPAKAGTHPSAPETAEKMGPGFRRDTN